MSLVGRREEIDASIALVAEHRAVTITRARAPGKTRLATKVASRALERFDYGDGPTAFAPGAFVNAGTSAQEAANLRAVLS